MDKLIIPPKFDETYAPRPIDMAILQHNPWLEEKRIDAENSKETPEYETKKAEYDTLLAEAITAVKAVK